MSESSAEHVLRVQSLHALAYCERLFFLEEVEELRVADAAVFAGRRLHQELDEGERLALELASPSLGLMGKLDALRRRDGVLVVTEQKRGRPAPSTAGPVAWPSDELQVAAYGLLLQEAFPTATVECRVRYHQPPASVVVALDAAMRARVLAAIARARLLRSRGERPPVADNERLCAKCSLAPVCLPEEEREGETPVRLFPEHDVRQTVHVTVPGSRVGKTKDELKISLDGVEDVSIGAKTVSSVVLHGPTQISSQALAMCASQGIGVQWFSGSGKYIGCLGAQSGSIHRRLRQFEALRDASTRLGLAKRLVAAKLEAQLRFLLRASRESPQSRATIGAQVRDLRQSLASARHADSPASLLGIEGSGAARYFSALPALQSATVDDRLRWSSRSRRPPADRFNAILSFFYSLVQRDVEAAVITVGLDTAFGFYHQPRGSIGPLVLDLMELFRVPLADMPAVSSINRQTWNCETDFQVASRGGNVTGVWLSPDGRRKAIEIYERRRQESWKHTKLGYSLSYARLIELEVRLLEKEWSGRPGLFASFRLR